jgi:hypothetical protein
MSRLVAGRLRGPCGRRRRVRAHGRTRYLTDDRSAVDREFANVFVCRFDDEGRCREFTEYYMRKRPEAVPE